MPEISDVRRRIANCTTHTHTHTLVYVPGSVCVSSSTAGLPTLVCIGSSWSPDWLVTPPPWASVFVSSETSNGVCQVAQLVVAVVVVGGVVVYEVVDF